MGWTLKGAHLLLQTRTKVLNNELDDVFRRWYPRFRPQAHATEVKAEGSLTPGLLLLSTNHTLNQSATFCPAPSQSPMFTALWTREQIRLPFIVKMSTSPLVTFRSLLIVESFTVTASGRMPGTCD